MLRTVEEPARIYAGKARELLGTREIESGKWLVAVYRELGDDGFVITAFLTAAGCSARKEKAALAVAEIQGKLKESREGLVWMSYDAEADTLYVNYKRPSHATDSELTDDDVIVRYDGEEIVGFTILHASQR